VVGRVGLVVRVDPVVVFVEKVGRVDGGVGGGGAVHVVGCDGSGLLEHRCWAGGIRMFLVGSRVCSGFCVLFHVQPSAFDWSWLSLYQIAAAAASAISGR